MENGYEKLYILVSYPDVQQEILDVLKPVNRETREIDNELAKKRLDLLNKMLKLYNAKFSKFEYDAVNNALILN